MEEGQTDEKMRNIHGVMVGLKKKKEVENGRM